MPSCCLYEYEGKGRTDVFGEVLRGRRLGAQAAFRQGQEQWAGNGASLEGNKSTSAFQEWNAS